jgi:hypothetical protein
MMTYELRQSCSSPMFGQGGATGIMGTNGMLVVTRSGCWLNPTREGHIEPVEFTTAQRQPAATPEQRRASDHWLNFLECIKTRQKPVSDIENLVRSSAVCILGNVSMRAGTRLDFDEKTFTVRQPEARQFTRIDYRAPWKLEV